MKILVVNPLLPRLEHAQAANVVCWELIAELAAQPDVAVGFLKLNRAEIEFTVDQDTLQRHFEAIGVEALPPVALDAPAPAVSAYRRLWPRPVDLYDGLVHRGEVEAAVEGFDPDVLFLPWTEIGTALCADLPMQKFAYYGNPDPRPFAAMTRFRRRHGEDTELAFRLKQLRLRRWEQLHMQQMRKYEILGDVAANDAEYYRERGHPNAFYIRNLWMDRPEDAASDIASGAGGEASGIVVGSIGNLAGTANTHGLEILGNQVLPALQRGMRGENYEVHLFGGGKPHPAVREGLDRPEVRMRGFVDDIDGEMIRSDVFLCANNASDYKVGHTRYLHAWSLGCCVVAHRDAALSMPEIVHGENALLGNTPEEMAEWTARALRDADLRRTIGHGGYRTFRSSFTASQVVPSILARIRNERIERA